MWNLSLDGPSLRIIAEPADAPAPPQPAPPAPPAPRPELAPAPAADDSPPRPAYAP